MYSVTNQTDAKTRLADKEAFFSKKGSGRKAKVQRASRQDEAGKAEGWKAKVEAQ